MQLDRSKVLIVDDEKPLRLGLAKCMKIGGFQPLEAADGNEALRLVVEHRPGVIILDVMMHGLSGLEVCRVLREDPQNGGMKIIILSARGQTKEKEEGLEAGGDYYITKPFDYRELMKIVKHLSETS